MRLAGRFCGDIKKAVLEAAFNVRTHFLFLSESVYIHISQIATHSPLNQLRQHRHTTLRNICCLTLDHETLPLVIESRVLTEEPDVHGLCTETLKAFDPDNVAPQCLEEMQMINTNEKLGHVLGSTLPYHFQNNHVTTSRVCCSAGHSALDQSVRVGLRSINLRILASVLQIFVPAQICHAISNSSS